MADAYSTHKLAAHPDALADLREGRDHLLTVHLMPQNLCNQRCSFCSYRMEGNKNSSVFVERAALPMGGLAQLFDDFEDLGVQGVEVTGGGEPLAYPYPRELFVELARRPFAVSLVTNGTLLNRCWEELLALGEKLRWVRVSVDAAKPATYATMRKTPSCNFAKAWQTVRTFAQHRQAFHEEFRLGAGFVLCNENIREVYDFTAIAAVHGADNVRLSSTFSDQHLGFFHDRDALDEAVCQSVRAEREFTTNGFHVYNMIPKRVWETEHPTQDYGPCYTKDLLCVVEGTGKVYSCCTFTGSAKGIWGNFLEHPDGFLGVWADAAGRRSRWDSRKECRVACLYRERNLEMIELVDGRLEPSGEKVIHKEFI
jgi:molybdenum cofactor biosynthesis enzyme MoaA